VIAGLITRSGLDLRISQKKAQKAQMIIYRDVRLTNHYVLFVPFVAQAGLSCDR